MTVKKRKEACDTFAIFEELYFKDYVKIHDSNPNGIIIMGENGYIRYINHMAGYLIGIQPSLAPGMSLKEIIKDSLLAEVQSKGVSIYNKQILINGRSILYTAIPIKLRDRIFSVLIILIDTHNMESVESKLIDLKKKNDFFELLMNQLFDEFIAINEKGNIVYISSKSRIIRGIDADNMQSINMFNMDSDFHLNKVIESGTPNVNEIYRPNKEWMTMYEVPIFEGNKLIGAGCYIISSDLNKTKSVFGGLRKKNKHLVQDTPTVQKTGCKYCFNDIKGESNALKKVKKDALRAAGTDSTVLIMGDSGTGKELFAQAIHAASSRKNGPFIRVNCAGIPETLIEADLFGYDPGAFTGAKKEGKEGKFELAHKGTLFFDEIAEMPMTMQAKLLSVIQEGIMYQRVGGSNYYDTDVRIIAATNKNLLDYVNTGKFREDLYYRLDVVSLKIPALCERRADIQLLVKYFIPNIAEAIGVEVKEIDAEALKFFELYDWPGNIRELRNVLEAAMNFTDGEMIMMSDLPTRIRENMIHSADLTRQTVEAQETPLGVTQLTEKELIKKALRLKSGNSRQAAISINMPRSTFYYKLKRYQIREH